MLLSHTKITSKGQVTIPVKVMKHLKVKPGDLIAFDAHDDHITITPCNAPFTLDAFIKKHSSKTKIKLSQKQLNAAKAGAWQ